LFRKEIIGGIPVWARNRVHLLVVTGLILYYYRIFEGFVFCGSGEKYSWGVKYWFYWWIWSLQQELLLEKPLQMSLSVLFCQLSM